MNITLKQEENKLILIDNEDAANEYHFYDKDDFITAFSIIFSKYADINIVKAMFIDFFNKNYIKIQLEHTPLDGDAMATKLLHLLKTEKL